MAPNSIAGRSIAIASILLLIIAGGQGLLAPLVDRIAQNRQLERRISVLENRLAVLNEQSRERYDLTDQIAEAMASDLVFRDLDGAVRQASAITQMNRVQIQRRPIAQLDGGVEWISISVTANGDLLALDMFLERLALRAERFLVSDLELAAAGRQRPDDDVRLMMTIGLLVRSSAP